MTDWKTLQKDFSAVTTPIIKGYHADKGLIGSKIATTDHLDEVVTYTANGRIIPIDEVGNEIPNAPHPRYQTDPKDATKVLSSKTLPKISGYTPRVEEIAPEDPSTDAKVVYNKKLIVQLKALEDRGYTFVNNGWNADKRQFGTINTPVISGYHADKRIAGGNTVSPSHIEEIGTVNYKVIIPVYPKGQPILGAKHLQYRTDSNDPTKVVLNQSVPEVLGYFPTQSAVMPSRPDQDMPIVYNPDQQQ